MTSRLLLPLRRSPPTTTVRPPTVRQTTRHRQTSSATARTDMLVSTEWLQERLVRPRVPRVVPVDGSWHMPATGRKALSEFTERHIPQAVYFDIDEISAPSCALDLPHMLPTVEAFNCAMDRLGIRNQDHVVVYDDSNVYSAFRVWWTFKVFGHEQVSVLDGGLGRWAAERRPVECKTPGGASSSASESTSYRATWNAQRVTGFEQVVENQTLGNIQLVDARSADRFHSHVPEPRPGVRSGHVPGSVNLPFTELVDQERRQLRPVAELRLLFEQKGIDLKRPIVFMCGSGVTASVLAFAAELCGGAQISVYDGSWTEFALRVAEK